MTPLRIGLTGGIASGKSMVAEAFRTLGVPIHSADHIAHELTAPGSPLLQEVRKRFGDQVFSSDGSLNREALAAIVFSDTAARLDLERILHPAIRDRLREDIAASGGDYCIVEIPLLRREDIGKTVDRVLVVDLPESLQQERLRARDQRPQHIVDAILAAQASRQDRLDLADDVLDNSHDTAILSGAVRELDALYRDIAIRGDPGRPGLRLPAS